MEEHWLEFDEGPSQPRDSGYASMNRIGEIVINRHFYEEMNRPEAVVLLYDPNNDNIGLKPASRRMPNAFPFRTKGLCKNHLVRAKPFIARHDIRVDGTVRFRHAEIRNGILVLSLRNMINVKKSSRDRGRRR